MVSFFICSMTAANPKQKRSRTLLIIDMIEKLAYVFCDLPHRLITTCKLQVCLTFTKNLSIGTKWNKIILYLISHKANENNEVKICNLIFMVNESHKVSFSQSHPHSVLVLVLFFLIINLIKSSLMDYRYLLDCTFKQEGLKIEKLLTFKNQMNLPFSLTIKLVHWIFKYIHKVQNFMSI